MRRITCFVADDDREACLRMKEIIEKIPDLQFLGYDQNPDKAIQSVCDYKPDILFVDVEMPGKSGFDVINEIKAKNLTTKFIFISAFDHYAIKAIKESAFDYLLKPIDINEFRAAVNRYTKPKYSAAFENKGLTDREKEVASLLIQGKTSRNIAQRLFISKYTVDTHRKSILKKLGFRSSNEMIASFSTIH